MNNKELINAGHELAKAISADTPIIEIAKMVTRLATALDVQQARANALAAENAGLNEFISAECWIYDMDVEQYRDAVDYVPETPATDAFLAEVRAQGVEMLLDVYRSRWISPHVEDADRFAAQLRKGDA
ncbi:hypothetical protein [Citrobacter amalonaticus]